jgi:hypothetical protein
MQQSWSCCRYSNYLPYSAEIYWNKIGRGKGHPMICLCRHRGVGVAPTHSKPDNRWRWVASTTFRPLYSRYLLYKRLCGIKESYEIKYLFIYCVSSIFPWMWLRTPGYCQYTSIIYIFFFVKGPRTTALRLFVQPQWRWWGRPHFYQFLQSMEHQWNEIDRVKPTTRRKTCPSATLSTTNLTWTWPGTEPRASVVRGRRLTSWAMSRPIIFTY